MMSGSAAGHTFVHGLCSCGRRWLDIADADDTCIEQDGYAHSGTLTSHELFQIRALKAKQDAIMETVLGMKKDKAA